MLKWWCGVAQLVARRLAGRQARVQFSARHHREVCPTELTSNEEMERGLGECIVWMWLDDCMYVIKIWKINKKSGKICGWTFQESKSFASEPLPLPPSPSPITTFFLYLTSRIQICIAPKYPLNLLYTLKDIVQPKKRWVKRGISRFISTSYTIDTLKGLVFWFKF